MNRSLSMALLPVLLTMLLPLHAAAQEPRFGRGSLLVDAAVLIQPDVVDGFSEHLGRGGEFVGEVGGGVMILPWLGAFVFGRAHAQVMIDAYDNGLVPSFPVDSGTVVFTRSAARGYPYASTGARIAVFSGPPHGGAFRGYAGGEWLPGKSMVSPLFGFGLSLPVRRVLLVGEAERRLLKVPYERVEATFRDGQVVAERRERQRRDELRWALRLGIEVPVQR